jgi:alpha-glucosidase
MSDSQGLEWWRGGVLYQVYPRSFKDSGAKGHGDLKGIIEKLDYLAALGIDAIWISPFFKSPMKDYGYDISDYCNVDPLFGTLDDFKTLLGKAHVLGLKIIIDMVMSHTSDEHPWFKESMSSAGNPKSDWYVWADPKDDGTPPNNWLSIFGGSAWQFSPLRGQYYLHNFLKEQPDLNYHNPQVVEEMLRQCRFWFDLGVDGFRLDAVNFCYCDKELRDNPPRDAGGVASQLEFRDAYAMQWHIYDKSRPENIGLMKKIRALADEYQDCMTLAEIGDDYMAKIAAAYSAGKDLLHTAYSFALMSNKGGIPPAKFFQDVIEEQRAQEGESWPTWAFSNHDVIRAASRWSGTNYGHDPRLSKMLVALLCSLRGTPLLYQGEELGLPEADILFENILDPWGKYLYPKWKGRDGSRTPMPWTGGPMTGFTQATKTWLPIPVEHRALNAELQKTDPASVLTFTQKFLHWRRTEPALIDGEMDFHPSERDDVLIYTRILNGNVVQCVFNLSAQTAKMEGTMLAPYEARFARGSQVLFTSAS